MAKVLLINPSKWGRGITAIWIPAHVAALRGAGPVQHRAPQVECNVILLAHAKSQSHQRRIKHELPAARHQRYLVFVAELSRETLGGYHAAEPATQD